MNEHWDDQVVLSEWASRYSMSLRPADDRERGAAEDRAIQDTRDLPDVDVTVVAAIDLIATPSAASA